MLKILKLTVKWWHQKPAVVAKFHENICLFLAYSVVKVSATDDVSTVTFS